MKLISGFKKIIVFSMAVIFFAANANAQAQEIKGETVGASTTVTAKVLSVDQKTRKVKIERTKCGESSAGEKRRYYYCRIYRGNWL
jgi:Cu/Ag efflux protein CusF